MTTILRDHTVYYRAYGDYFKEIVDICEKNVKKCVEDAARGEVV